MAAVAAVRIIFFVLSFIMIIVSGIGLHSKL